MLWAASFLVGGGIITYGCGDCGADRPQGANVFQVLLLTSRVPKVYHTPSTVHGELGQGGQNGVTVCPGFSKLDATHLSMLSGRHRLKSTA